jgi:hypothetical protein
MASDGHGRTVLTDGASEGMFFMESFYIGSVKELHQRRKMFAKKFKLFKKEPCLLIFLATSKFNLDISFDKPTSF